MLRSAAYSACPSTRGFAPIASERVCREADYTVDQALSRQKLQIIVVHAWNQLELLRVGGRFVQTSAMRWWHDAVLLAGND